MNIFEFIAETSIVEDEKKEEFVRGFKYKKDLFEWINHFMEEDDFPRRHVSFSKDF